ncbi:hypothetical protein KKC91_07500 [bacterium]|nr:hypothetical protein [bacterium]
MENYRFGVIFCAKCGSLLVDSGFTSPTSLKCYECENVDDFKVGKVLMDSPDSKIEDLLNQAVRDAHIEKLRSKFGKRDKFTKG